MQQKSMMLLGDEAIGMAAIHAGIKASYAYPGTPATEIQETVQKYAQKFPENGLLSSWSINEKVAMEESVGTSMIGLRSLVNMKHVGLNVAADPFMNAAICGCLGGLVVAVGDDPSMHSSQNEQDSRFYADFAHIPCFEPSNQQECYDMTREAFSLSERMEIPVLIRIVTRLAHTRAKVKFETPNKGSELKIPSEFNRWTLLPVNARPLYEKLLGKQKGFIAEANSSRFNELKIAKGSKIGVIASGLGFSYLMECLSEDNIELSWLKIGQYPLSEVLITKFISGIEEIIVLEDGYPFIERLLPSYLAREGKQSKVKGRLTGHIPAAGELGTDIVRSSLGLAPNAIRTLEKNDLVRPRPPALCKGCPHCDTFGALNTALEGHENERVVFSDIGCYTLGFYKPYQSIHSCLCMGASVSMAKAAGGCGLKISVAAIGDSTFNHSGITPLLEGIKNNTPFTVVILDNSTTAMTGGQDTICGGGPLEKLILGMGLDQKHLKIIEPLPKNHKQNAKTIREECEYRGTSVVIARRKCLQI